MGKWALVAIPNQDDYVWNISSEKVPHLTLLFLGERETHPNLANILEFIEHTIKTTKMHSFGLSVSHRGELGPEEADVLFFSKYNLKKLQDLRTFLLTNDDISAMYHNTPQFPVWTPHLTLGFPKTPAKKDTREHPGTSWVNFDRISLWTEDSEGTEFMLMEHDMTDEMEFMMSERAKAIVFDVLERNPEKLEHVGVKGMKWGVRKKEPKAPASADATTASGFRTTAKKSGTDALSNKELQSLVTRMNLEQQYNRLSSQSANKSAARKFVERLFKDPNYRNQTKNNIDPLITPIKSAFELRNDLANVKLD